MIQIEHSKTKNLWPLLLMAVMFLLLAGGSFLCAFSVWIGIVLTWIACGLLCWFVILRYYPPTPLVDSTLSVGAPPSPSRPFSIRDIPSMVLWLIPIALVAPFGLVFFYWARNRHHDGR
jgi:hypothetical protein